MKPQQYIALIRRWWWLVVLGVIVGGGFAYVTYRDGGTTYTAETRLFVGGTLYSPDPTGGDLQTSSEMAVIYSNLAQYDVVLHGVIDELSFEMSTGQLRKKVSAALVESTPLLIISVTDSQYDRSIAIANSVAEQLITYSPTNLTPEQQAQVDLATSQIDILRERLDGIVQEVQAIDQQIEDLSFDETTSTTNSGISPRDLSADRGFDLPPECPKPTGYEYFDYYCAVQRADE